MIDIEVNIGEYNFINEEQCIQGFAIVEENKIYVKEARVDVITHELIHILYSNPETSDLILQLFSEFHNQTFEEALEDKDFTKYFDFVYEQYEEKWYDEEILAFSLCWDLIDIFDEKPDEPIIALQDYIFNKSDIFIRIKYQTYISDYIFFKPKVQ